MKSLTMVAFTTLLLSTLTTAFPKTKPTRHNGTQAGWVQLNAITASIDDPNAIPVTVPATIAQIATPDETLSITALQIVPGSGEGVDADDVTCQMYTDASGVTPQGTTFGTTYEADYSTNAIEMGYVLCWVTGSD